MKHILLIEEDLDDQEIFLSALGNLEVLIACETALSGHEALKRLQSGDVKPDLIFLDFNMAGMRGFKFLNQIKLDPDLRKIPVIIFSDSADASEIEMAKNAGAWQFITKPEKIEELEKILYDSIETLQ
jgi:CheY-like chemotaxis protein